MPILYFSRCQNLTSLYSTHAASVHQLGFLHSILSPFYYSIYLLHLFLLHALHSTLTCISIHSSVAAVRFTSAPRALSVRFTILFIYPHICHVLDSFIYFFSILTITSFYYQYVLPVYFTYLSLYMYILSTILALGSR